MISTSRKEEKMLFNSLKFANHSYYLNAKFKCCDLNMMQIIAMQDIEVGHEITTYYSDHYFGENNY